jgi:hypothetical protein
MPFAFYARLSPRSQAIYRRSDAVTTVPLPDAAGLQADVAELRRSLLQEERRAVEQAAAILSSGLLERLAAPPVRLSVLAVRPSSSWGELHGLYTREDGELPRIQLWMRTAHHKRVVAFRTFLRTLLHEVAHHLDYELLRLADSFHTEGFFRRESSLFKQLVPEAAGRLRGGPGVAQDSESPRPGRK